MFFALKHSGGWFLQGQDIEELLQGTLEKLCLCFALRNRSEPPWQMGKAPYFGSGLQHHGDDYITTETSTFFCVLCKQASFIHSTVVMFKLEYSSGTVWLNVTNDAGFDSQREPIWPQFVFSLVSDFPSIPSSLFGLSFISSPLLFRLIQIIWKFKSPILDALCSYTYWL